MRHRKWSLATGLTGLMLLSITFIHPVSGAAHPRALATDRSEATATVPDSMTVAPSPTLAPPVSVERDALQPSYTGCGGGTAPVVNAAYEQEVVERVNAARAGYGLPPLKRVTALDDAARYHATDMGQDDYFDHNSYDRSGGSLVYVCEWSSRIQSYYPNWQSLAENIAAGYTTPESVMSAWLGSSGHRANILSTSNWEIGVGYYEGSGHYIRYWARDFGRRSDVYPVVINREAATTDSREVSLYLYGDWDEVRLRNDSGSWTGWQPFQAAMAWILNSGRGEHIVWAEMRSGGTTVVSSDGIYLTVGPPVLGDLPDSLHFAYSIVEERLIPTASHVELKNVGNEDALTWTVTQEGDWYTVTPLSGATPASLWIIPSTFSKDTVGVYTGAVTVMVSDPPDAEGSPQRIDLRLQVIDGPFRYGYLPLLLRSHVPFQP